MQKKLGLIVDEPEEKDAKFNLVDIADEYLNAEQIKKKRIQKMHHKAAQNREERKRKQEEEKLRIEELRKQDPEKYLKNLHQ